EAIALVVRGNFAYVASGAAGLTIVNVADGAHPAVAGRLPLSAGDFAGGVDVDAAATLAVLAVAGDRPRLVTVDVSNAAAPSLRGAVDLAGDPRDVLLS